MLRDLYDRDPTAFFQSSWSFSWWRHGGGPGLSWLSDKIDLTAGGGRVAGKYIKARRVRPATFETKVVEFVGPVPRDVAERLFHAVFSVKVFERTFPSEELKVGGAMAQTFEMSAAGARATKTLVDARKDGIDALWSACEAVRAHLEQTGEPHDVPKQP